MLTAFSIAFALAAISPTLADLGKDTLFKNGLPFPQLDRLPFGGFTYVGVSVPSICTSHAADTTCDTSTMQAFQASYADCSEPWTLCRCADAQMSVHDLLVRFAQIPPGVRSYVGGALAVSADSCSAGSAGDFIVFNGDCVQAVFDHEAGHSLDQSTSPSDAWTAALDDSSCVPDDYANTSPAEDFAQTNVIYTYETRVGTLPSNPSCMQPQINVFKNDERLAAAHAAKECIAEKRPFHLNDNQQTSKRLTGALYTGPITPHYFHENPARK